MQNNNYRIKVSQTNTQFYVKTKITIVDVLADVFVRSVRLESCFVSNIRKILVGWKYPTNILLILKLYSMATWPVMKRLVEDTEFSLCTVWVIGCTFLLAYLQRWRFQFPAYSHPWCRFHTDWHVVSFMIMPRLLQRSVLQCSVLCSLLHVGLPFMSAFFPSFILSRGDTLTLMLSKDAIVTRFLNDCRLYRDISRYFWALESKCAQIVTANPLNSYITQPNVLVQIHLAITNQSGVPKTVRYAEVLFYTGPPDWI